MSGLQQDLFSSAPDITLLESRARRDEGISRAVEHADRVRDEWSAEAFNFLCDYARTSVPPFLVEEARAAAESAGLECPTDNRAWGGVVQRAVRAGIIVRAGAAPALTSNCSLKPLWRLSGEQ